MATNKVPFRDTVRNCELCRVGKTSTRCAACAWEHQQRYKRKMAAMRAKLGLRPKTE